MRKGVRGRKNVPSNKANSKLTIAQQCNMESVAKNYYTYTRAMPGSSWNVVQLKRRNSSTGRQNGEASEFFGKFGELCFLVTPVLRFVFLL